MNSPEIHTLMCLSCHDGSVGGGTHDMGGSIGGPGTFGTNSKGSFNPSDIGSPAYSTFTGAGSNNGWVSGSTLLTNHPVHTVYTSGGYNWKVTIDATNMKVTWNDTSFVPYTGSPYAGHPAKLYTDGTSAYVECTSCHEPHRLNHIAYQNGSNWVVDTGTGAATTADYVRGPYNVPGDTHGGNGVANGEQNSGFCRSCHFSKSVDYVNNLGISR
jgi:hypothetical protein